VQGRDDLHLLWRRGGVHADQGNEMFGEEKDDVVEENVKVKKPMKEGELCLNLEF
jgi:hypothetical protein